MTSQLARYNLIAALAAKGLRYVGTRGNVNAPVVFVGEAPGQDEDSAGLPFVGVSGRLLDTMITEAGFDSNDYWFTNVYKTRPPDNDLERLDVYGIPREVFHTEFMEELRDRRPVFIVACGATPLAALCPQTVDTRDSASHITHWRGSLLTSPHLDWPHYVFPILHPAFILREWSEKYFNTFLLRKLLAEFTWYRRCGTLQPLTERENIVQPSYDDAYAYLFDCCERRSTGPVSVDIELLRRKIPYTISFAKTAYSAISIGLGDYNEAQTTKLFLLMDKIFRTVPVVGQNYFNFDCHWLRACGWGINLYLTDDTRTRHSVLWPELPHKLEFLTQQYTREPYYKEEGRSWNKVHGTGKQQLMRYNNKDTMVTREAYDVQEMEFNNNPALRKFYYSHELPLARAMHNMEYRGLYTDSSALLQLKKDINDELVKMCLSMTAKVGKPVVFDAAQQKKIPGSTNIGSPVQLTSVLKARGLKVPNGTAEEKLHVLFAETGDELLNEVLTVRELIKIKGTYVEARLVDNVLYADYVVGGTVTGRRSSKGWPLGFGVNHQNLPKHSKLGKKFRKCIVARPGKILLSADQVSAEDWIIQGIIADLTGDDSGVNELRSGLDRHCKLAQKIFGLPESECNREAERSGKIFRYVGKRVRYAGSYDMHAPKFATVLAKEGLQMPVAYCEFVLDKFYSVEPNIRGVFQDFIQRSISTDRKLTNLFGRQRDFFGFCSWRDNGSVFREGYSYVPQGTVGDNTGEAALFCERKAPGLLVAETHDALTLEVADDVDSIFFGIQLLKNAFHRTLRFKHGYELEIPIEYELGYNLKDTIGCDDLTRTGLTAILTTLQQSAKAQDVTISGAQQPPLQPVSNETCGSIEPVTSSIQISTPSS